MRKFSAPALLVFTLALTFAYIDWILSADAQFFSTVYGAMILIGDILQTFALTILAIILTSKDDRFGGRINSKILHDLGNLMFAFTIFWTYLSASQLIIVWPANLPQELVWYLDRVGGFWKWVTPCHRAQYVCDSVSRSAFAGTQAESAPVDQDCDLDPGRAGD